MPRPFPPVIPPPLAEQHGASYPQLVALMQRLLAPDGCPWDRQQSYASLRRYMLEEASEATDAIDRGDLDELRDELGDVLFQVVFLGELARRDGAFGPDDVVAGIVDKLVRRHPHVFADEQVAGAEEVPDRWERIKAAERAAKGETRGVLARVPKSLPALSRAQRMGDKAAKVGFDWSDRQGPRNKLDEELQELDEAIAAGDQQAVAAELGDVLFAVTNLARHLGVDSAEALRGCLRKFERRFSHVEARARQEHGGLSPELPLELLDRYWDEAKQHEAAVVEAPPGEDGEAGAGRGEAPKGVSGA